MAGDTPDRRTDSALEELFYTADTVRFVHWRAFSGAKTTVLLMGVVAVVAFITGLSNLGQEVIDPTGPLAPFVPGPADFLRLYGITFAFLLGALTVGLQRQLRIAWYGATVALPLLALLPLVTGNTTNVILLVVLLITYPLLLYNREAFDQKVDLSPFQQAALLTFVGVQIYGTAGTYVMRDGFVGIETPTDAFYYIIVTGTTVGYGDATPTQQLTKLFTLSIIVLGTVSFTIASGSLIIPALESRISSAFGNMTASELNLLEDHVLVLGHDDITEPLLDDLVPKSDVVVVTEDTDAASELRDDGIDVLTDDPTDGETLLDARIESARGVVVATADDARDVLAILAARQTNPDVRIVAAAADQQHVQKLRDVGADEVISPTIIAGQMLSQSVLGEETPAVGPIDEDRDEESEVRTD